MKNKPVYGIKEFSIRIIKPVLVVLIVILFGTFYYSVAEGWALVDSFYMSVISLTTVGYETPEPLSIHGKVFTSFYLLFSVVIFLYLASEFARHIINMNIQEYFSKRQMDSRIKNLKNHYIICGFGRTGRAIATHLSNEDVEFVIVDKDREAVLDAKDLNYLAIDGDCTNDEILRQAKIANAKGLFAALNQDSDNLFLTITAKDFNPDLNIVVRCSQAGNEDKFHKVGVKHVISPYTISGLRMVSSVLRPLVADFLDEMADTKIGLELRMEQFYLPNSTRLHDKSILDSEIRPKSGANILAIKRGENFMHNPSAETVLKSGDYLVVIGTSDQLTKLDQLINSKVHINS